MTKCNNCDSTDLNPASYARDAGSLPALPALQCATCGCLLLEESPTFVLFAVTVPPLPCVSSLLPPTRR